MAGIKINQYPLERLTFGDDDYYDIDYWNGTAFETAKIKGSVIKLAIQAGIVSNNLFTADLSLLANRLHDIADKSIQFDISKATGNSGNFRITNNAIVGYLYDTQIPANLTTVNQQSDAIILTADGGASATVFSIVRGEGSLSNGNNGFSFNANTKLTIITGTNGDIQIGDPTNNTNTFYNDISTNLYGILLKGFGETSETDATGANYSTLVGTSLVPKKYVDDTIASSPASNISNSNLTFGANHYADLGSYSWTLGGTAPIGSSKICFLKDVLVKGTDNAEVTSGFKVTDVNNDILFDIRNNGQIGYGGEKHYLYAHKFRNPNNEARIVSFDDDMLGTESFVIQTNGRFYSEQFGQTVFISYRQAGQSYAKIYDAGVESIRLGKAGSFINGALRVGGISGSTTGTTGARFEIQQQSTNTFQQLFFANARVVTLGRINSSGSYGTTQAGLECYDTDINKKYFWNGTEWEKIKGNIESVSVATATTLTPNIDTSEMEIVSALAGTLTIASPTGTPHEGKELTFRIKDDGTARLVVWDSIFEDYTGSLPSTTVANKTVYIGCKYNAVDTKWDVVAVQNQP